MSRILRKFVLILIFRMVFVITPKASSSSSKPGSRRRWGTTKMADRGSPNGGGATIMLMAIMVDVAYFGQDIRPLGKD